MSMRPRLSFETYASDRLLQERAHLAQDWMTDLVEVLGTDPYRSGADALDPAGLDATLQQLAHYAEDGIESAFTNAADVVEPMHALGAWCARHGSDGRALLVAIDRLAARLDAACLQWVREFPSEPCREQVVKVSGRLNRGPIMMASLCVSAFERAWATSPARGDFTELLAHELSTPINAAEVAAVLLENDRVTPGSQELRRLAGTIQRSLRRVRALIGDVHDLAAAHSDGDHSERIVPIGQLLGEVLAELGQLAREAGVRIDIEEPVPAVTVPGARVAVVLRNLVSNAIKYADPAAQTRWVRISFMPAADGRWSIAVSDNGLGIPRDQHDRVFERFIRLHPERADGTGLGLAIAHETALRMQSGIEFDSEPGVGSTFRFTLPQPPEAPRHTGA